MINKKQIIALVVWILVVGFFVLSISEAGFSGESVPGGPPCCSAETSVGSGENACVGGEGAELECEPDNCGSRSCTFYADRICIFTGEDSIGACVPPPQIPTINQWGKIITIAVIGLFALIGIFAMRRRTAGTG